MNREEVLGMLRDAAEPSFKEFNDRITNCSTAPSLGVRVPVVRATAGVVVKNGWEEYLDEMERTFCAAPHSGNSVSREKSPADAASMEKQTVRFEKQIWQEEHMLWGMVIGSANMSREERTAHLDLWVPGILSWADCDCTVSSMKFLKKEQDYWFAYCSDWQRDGGEFPVRFSMVALMQYFIQDAYIDRALEIFSLREAEPYYIRMAQAWALSVCFVKYRDKALELFASHTLDAWVQNKAIQKCRESYRVSPEDKERLKEYKMK